MVLVGGVMVLVGIGNGACSICLYCCWHDCCFPCVCMKWFFYHTHVQCTPCTYIHTNIQTHIQTNTHTSKCSKYGIPQQCCC